MVNTVDGICPDGTACLRVKAKMFEQLVAVWIPATRVKMS